MMNDDDDELSVFSNFACHFKRNSPKLVNEIKPIGRAEYR